MDDDQIGALRDFVSAAYHYLTAPKSEAPARRVALCEAVGALLFALEGPLPDDPDDDDGDDDTVEKTSADEPSLRSPLRLIKPPQEGAIVIPLYGIRPRHARRPKRDRR